MAPVYQFVFGYNSENLFIVEAETWLDAAEAIVGARKFEDVDDDTAVEITPLTTNSVIRAESD